MTKQIVFIVVFTITFFTCQYTCHAQAPEAVKRTFQKMYPGEDDPDWHIDDHGNFESNFKMNGIKYRADFSPNGNWIETENSIDKRALPQAIKTVLKAEYPSEEITEVEQVNHHSKGLFYDVEFKRKGKNKDVEFKANGEIIKVK